MFVEYRTLGFALKYSDMVILKTKGVKTRYNPDKPTSNCGDNNNKSGKPSIPHQEGEHNHTFDGVVPMLENSSVELINDGPISRARFCL